MADLERLKLAFALSSAKLIADADDRTDYGEFKLLGQIFPRPLLVDHGFLDAEGRFTEALAEAFDEARRVLPDRLTEAEKLDVLTIFYGTSVADDELDGRELEVIRDAARLLGVPIERLTDHLAQVRREEG